MKSHTCFLLVLKLVTLNDLERRNGRYLALFLGIRPLPRTHPQKILATPVGSILRVCVSVCLSVRAKAENCRLELNVT